MFHVTSGSFLARRSKARMGRGPKHEAKDTGLTRREGPWGFYLEIQDKKGGYT